MAYGGVGHERLYGRAVTEETGVTDWWDRVESLPCEGSPAMVLYVGNGPRAKADSKARKLKRA